jgi:hypothetical protein
MWFAQLPGQPVHMIELSQPKNPFTVQKDLFESVQQFTGALLVVLIILSVVSYVRTRKELAFKFAMRNTSSISR